MKILLTNDDGIEAAGIVRLARMARRFGEVCVVAPDRQCSAMSQRITVRGDMEVRLFFRDTKQITRAPRRLYFNGTAGAVEDLKSVFGEDNVKIK